MASYPYRDALRDAHDIYLNAMHPFVIGNALNVIEGEIEIGDIAHIIAKDWSDFFKQWFKGVDSYYEARSAAWQIVESRNRASHPPWDLDPEYTRTHLFLIADMLGKIGKDNEKDKVEDIRDQLFSDYTEEQPIETELATAYQKRLTDMSSQLAIAVAEKATAEKRLADILSRLKAAEAKKSELEKCLADILSQLETARIEKTELEERLSEIEEYLPIAETEETEYEESFAEIAEHLSPSAKMPNSVTFQGTIFTKRLNKYHVSGDDITQTFWYYWRAQGRDGKQKMREAGWSVEKVGSDWEVTISPEDFEAWIENEVTQLNNLLNSSQNKEPLIQPMQRFSERTILPTGKEIEQPALEFLSDEKEHRRVEIIDRLTEHFSLTDDERSYLSKTGQAEKHLMNKGLIKRTRKGYYRITTHGLQVLR